MISVVGTMEKSLKKVRSENLDMQDGNYRERLRRTRENLPWEFSLYSSILGEREGISSQEHYCVCLSVDLILIKMTMMLYVLLSLESTL